MPQVIKAESRGTVSLVRRENSLKRRGDSL
jgi:hypothetical protein